MQGLTTSKETHLVVLEQYENYSKVKYKYEIKNLTQATNAPFIKMENFPIPESHWAITKISLSNLNLNSNYQLNVFKNDKLYDQRQFKALDLSKQNAKIAVASCMDDSFIKRQKPMWQSLVGKNPDYIFLIGDNSYSDKHFFQKGPAKPQTLWSRNIETRMNIELFKINPLVPILATWDDHDYGANNGGKDYKYKKESKEIFKHFFSQPDVKGVSENGPGVSLNFKAFGQNFVFIDNRYFRVTDAKKPFEQTHWGLQQEKWVLSKLDSAKELTWLIQGDQFFGAYHTFESYEGLSPYSFKSLLAKIDKKSSPVFFVSGDRHLTEIMKITKPDLSYDTFELTSSGIHAFVFPDAWAKNKNPRQLVGASGVFNYSLLDILPKKSNNIFSLDVRSYGENNKTLYNKIIEIKK
jgi:alkaline phosphatase D